MKPGDYFSDGFYDFCHILVGVAVADDPADGAGDIGAGAWQVQIDIVHFDLLIGAIEHAGGVAI